MNHPGIVVLIGCSHLSRLCVFPLLLLTHNGISKLSSHMWLVATGLDSVSLKFAEYI